MLQYLKYRKTHAYNELPLAADLAHCPLIPVIFSHGLIGNRTFYQLVGQEFASNGFIVFIIDHLDGSNM